MAKYKCMEGKGCINNNHGWCVVLKKNGLKSVKDCNHFDDGNNKKDVKEKTSEEDVGLVLEVGRVIGKREMLYYIQKECLAKGEPLTIEDINKYSKLLEFEEEIYDVEKHEMMIQNDMRNSSKSIAKETI